MFVCCLIYFGIDNSFSQIRRISDKDELGQGGHQHAAEAGQDSDQAEDEAGAVRISKEEFLEIDRNSE